MNRLPSKRGSALLIVLGMLSFMIVSAVGFAAYMRYARLPSSYLRRSASSRQLVKAAITEAIDAIDRAIGNNPHPGFGRFQYAQSNEGVEPFENIWDHRVFIGTRTNASEQAALTHVTPLTLEALAYLPPTLINEARYYPLRSISTSWQPFGFDAGRYVWTAIDVSDFFDINRLQADVARSSAANRRVSLAHVFESPDHRTPGNGAQQWETFMEQYRGKLNEDTLSYDLKGKYPFISMADFNLALGRKGTVGQMRSPFYDYVTGAMTQFIRPGGNSAAGADAALANMNFVTDSLSVPRNPNAQTTEGEPIVDLNDLRNQPFRLEFLENEKPALSELIGFSGSRLQKPVKGHDWVYYLSGLGCAALYDYLDPDHVPCSLAIPTLERVPMICGISPQLNGGQFAVEKTYAKSVGEAGQPAPFPHGDQDPSAAGVKPGTTRQCKQVVYYKINAQQFAQGIAAGEVQALCCFPFAHEDPTDEASWTIDGRLSFFLSSGTPSLRAGTADLMLDQGNTANTFNPQTGLLSVKLTDQQVSFKGKSINDEKDALERRTFRLANDASKVASALGSLDRELLRVEYEWTQTAQMGGGGLAVAGSWEPEWNAATPQNSGLKAISAHCGIVPQQWKNQTVSGLDPELLSDTETLKFVQNGGAKELTLSAAVWLRVKNQNGKVVDMVPASLEDDKEQNQINDPMSRAVLGQRLGAVAPLMLFETGVRFRYSVSDLDQAAATQIELVPKAAIVADPRYNHAPEHWYALNGELSPENWLQQIRNDVLGQGDRDKDIFMATSDAGYLQSRYEFAFLPRFNNLDGVDGNDMLGRYENLSAAQYARIATDFQGTMNRGMVWRTYDPLDENREDFRLMPFRNEGSGLMVNPYSDSTNVLMAVFANTPLDWKRASTNDVNVQGAKDYATMKASEFNREYAWNEYGNGGRITWQNLRGIASRFRQEMENRKQQGKDWTTETVEPWEEAWENMGWNYNRDSLCGVTLDGETDEIWGADRKFLYGFWRDCFGVSQQLFLVFARAEPMMMGGNSSGQIPPQLGARAMALVWRDPRMSRKSGSGTRTTIAPHQTRILFYRQFE